MVTSLMSMTAPQGPNWTKVMTNLITIWGEVKVQHFGQATSTNAHIYAAMSDSMWECSYHCYSQQYNVKMKALQAQ